MRSILNTLAGIALGILCCGGALYTWTTPDPGVVIPHAPILNR